MIIFCAITALLTLVLFYYLIKPNERDEAFKNIPKPRKYFLVHNAPLLWMMKPNNVLETFGKLHRELGEVFVTTLNRFDSGNVYISNPEIAEALSLHQPNRVGSEIYEAVSRWIGHGGSLLSMSTKKVKSGMIAVNAVHRSLQHVNKHAHRAVELSKSFDGPTDFFSFWKEIVLDLTFDLGFGCDFGNECNLEFSKAFEQFTDITVQEILDPRSKCHQLFKFTRLYNQEKKAIATMNKIVRQLIQTRKAALQDEQSDDLYVVDHLIKYPYASELMSDEEILGEMNSFLFAFYDTTKSAIYFLMYCLAKHPEIQEKVFQEASLILSHDPQKDIDDSDLSNLPYLEAVINETLRLYPSFPIVGRKLSSEISVGGFKFPKDTAILINIFEMNRSSKYFENPLDFKPDRFLGVSTKPLAFGSFSIGARKCMGQKNAMKTMKIFASRFIYNNEVSLYGEIDEEVVVKFILQPKNQVLFRSKYRH